MKISYCATCREPIPEAIRRTSMFCERHLREFEAALDNRDPIKDRESGETILTRIFERHS